LQQDNDDNRATSQPEIGRAQSEVAVQMIHSISPR
jgi:hypothetical protein